MNARALCPTEGRRTIRGPTDRATDSRVSTRTPIGAGTHRFLRVRMRRSVPWSVLAPMPPARTPHSVPTMHPAERDQDTPTRTVESSTEEGPALRDAAAVAARAARDEEEATAARVRFTTEAVPCIEPDDALAPHLELGEGVHSERRSAILRVPGGDRAHGYGGTLYLTSRRLVHQGQVMMTVQLTDIVETSLAGDRLLLALRNGEGMAFDVDRPRLLRAEMAAAMRALR